MKKSLLALAVLGAFAGAASAQSSVTIYGIVDVGVSKINDGQSNLTFLSTNQIGRQDAVTVRSSTPSRLGFRGSEDLGGGLKANFTLEHRLAPDIGNTEPGTVFWHGQAWVGLSGNFGEVRLGRQYVPAFWVASSSDPWGYDYNVAGVAGFTRAGDPISRANNSVTYRTPNLSGFSAEAQISAPEGGDATGTVGNAGAAQPGQAGYRNVGGNVQYSAGPLWVGATINDLHTTGFSSNHRFYAVGAAYDFGVVRPIVYYTESRLPASGGAVGTIAAYPAGVPAGLPAVGSEVKSKAYFVGATAPLGNGRLKAVVAKFDAGAGINFNGSNTSLPADYSGKNTTKVGVGYEYFLSKRTSVHADVGSAKTQTYSRTTGVEAGIKHVF